MTTTQEQAPVDEQSLTDWLIDTVAHCTTGHFDVVMFKSACAYKGIDALRQPQAARLIDRLTAEPAQQVVAQHYTADGPITEADKAEFDEAAKNAKPLDLKAMDAQLREVAQQVTREEIVFAMCKEQWRRKYPNGPVFDWSSVHAGDTVTEAGHFRRKAEISADAIMSLLAERGLVKEG